MSGDIDQENEENMELDTSIEGLQIDDDIYLPPPPKRYIEGEHGKGPRLIITKIMNKNFKSYAEEVIIGPFHQCFSAIVGPNGSGKSNIIDALLFVFGFRATKIRSKKVSNLIHHSSEHPNANSCTVGIYFQKIIDKEDGYDVVPDSDIVISKTAFKDNSSHYELNGKKVQFKEIAKLLRNEGVDLDYNRFLILQGEVEQIALMKPKAQNENDTGMLEFLDDIIGTCRFKVPLEKMVEKIDVLNERVTDRLNRLRIVENERNSMKEPMEEAVSYLKLENTIIKLQHKLFYCKKFSAADSLKEKIVILEEVSNDCNQLKEKIKAIASEKETKTAELTKKSKKWDEIQAKADEIKEKFDGMRRKDEALHAELIETNKRRKQNKAAIKTEEENLKKLEDNPKKCKEDIAECESLIQKHQENLEKEEDKLKTLMQSLQEKTEPLLKKRSDLEKKLIDFRKNINEAQGDYNLKESKLKLYTSEEKVEREKLEKLQQALKEAGEMLEDRKGQLDTFERKIPGTEKQLQRAQRELEELKVQDGELTNQLKMLRGQVVEQRCAMQANRSRNRVIDALLKAKKDGMFPGIFGRLGDLGAIDAKYDVAISTACGPLDNVVVDTTATAEACIQFLRNNNLGRTTFIALEKMQRFLPQCKQKINTPENVPRLFDLIKVQDEKILPAFYYGLHDTLVANELDQASRVAYGAKRYRVVTLKGELIEISGTMSGGGRTLRGRMGQKVVSSDMSQDDIEKLQQKSNKVEEKLNEVKQHIQPLEEKINELSTGLREMQSQREKFKIEVRSLGEQLPALKKQLKVQEQKAAAAKSNPAEVKKLTKAVEAAKQELEAAKDQSKTIEDKVGKINSEIEELSGNRVKEQQKKIKNLTDAISKAKNEIYRLEVVLKTNDRNINKVTTKIENLTADITKFETRIKTIEQEKKQFEVDGKALLDNLNELTEKLAERDENLASLKAELTALQDEEKELKASKIDVDQKLAEIKKTVTDLKQKIHEYERRINSLSLNKIPGEPVRELEELTEDNVKEWDAKTLAANLAAAKERLPETPPNMQIIEDYEQKDLVYIKRSGEVTEATEARNELRKKYDHFKRKRHEEFFAGFNVITTKLKEMYQMITLGGAAELELVDSLDPYAEGIAFSVRPPKKSWKNINNLSGGEKTLSSLALVFALHHYKPTPLYFMDEIDAALDFKNVSIVGTYIKERTKNAQFIVVSLRSEMFEMADTLVGIYKTHNATSSVTLNIQYFYQQHPEIEKREKIKRERIMIKSSQPGKKMSSQGVVFASQSSNFPSSDRTQIEPEVEPSQAVDKSPTAIPSTSTSQPASRPAKSTSPPKSAESAKNISNQRELRGRKISTDSNDSMNQSQRVPSRKRLPLDESSSSDEHAAASSSLNTSERSLRKKPKVNDKN